MIEFIVIAYLVIGFLLGLYLEVFDNPLRNQYILTPLDILISLLSCWMIVPGVIMILIVVGFKYVFRREFWIIPIIKF